MTPHWYDLLDVDPGASSDEIRAAWKSAIADLDPGDRRFRAYNEAAAVLLDPDRRAEYDASLAEAAETEAAETEPAPEPVAVRSVAVAPTPAPPAEPDPSPVSGDAVPTRRRGIPLAVVVAVAVATVLLLTLTAVVWLRSDAAPESLSTGQPAVDERAAQAAAETAVLDVLAYDYRNLEAGAEKARSFMTDDYREKYDQLFEVISEFAPKTQTVVTVELVASGIVRTGEDRVDVLVFVNRPTSKKPPTPDQVYRDQATLRMLLVDGEWLVDDVVTTPAAP